MPPDLNAFRSAEAVGQMNQGWTYCDRIGKAAAGMTLLQYYTQHYPHSSSAEWRERIEAGQILLEGQPTTPDTILRCGHRLSYHRLPWIEPPVPLEFEVLYEDADLLVVAKPAGLPVLPGGGFLQHTLLWQLQRRYPQDTPVPIHRLGRGTSGLMLLARSPLARSRLSQQMRHTSAQTVGEAGLRKTYRALVAAGDLPDRFTITQPIGKLAYPGLGYVYGATPTGKFAYSDCRVLQRQAETTLLEVTILTGRPHQIRIHLASMGFPLVGDPLYGVGGVPSRDASQLVNPALPRDLTQKLVVPGDCGYHLHAYQLCFRHPRSDRALSLICPPPERLRLDAEVGSGRD